MSEEGGSNVRGGQRVSDVRRGSKRGVEGELVTSEEKVVT